ncbi:unnamed protein product [Mycena citricolor]|uniref:Major facilitator superfamily (MFS) profile domain-containing protein n=1 Tax=Mycena citricolor TaxID=2018698 RepID=A0AAD2HNG7_9AGAR|nr:unnamed protein product [Mycena citricolor]
MDNEKSDGASASHVEDHSQQLSDGVYHQSRLGPKATRKHFFSPLDRSYAEAVNLDAEGVEFDQAEERRVRRKIDRVVLPLIVASYICACSSVFLDSLIEPVQSTNSTAPTCEICDPCRRFGIDHISGNAHTLTAFNKNFYEQQQVDARAQHLLRRILPPRDPREHSPAIHRGQSVVSIPQAHSRVRVMSRDLERSFFLALNFWGIASLSVVYAKGYAGLLVLRVLMGIGEAGYYAGMIYYLSFWYKKHELAMRISLCMTGTLPGAIGGLLAFGLVRAKTSLLEGWQFLFLIEAIPTIIMAFSILLFLPSFPFSASFLTPRERAIAQARLNRDHKPQSHGGMTGVEGLKVIMADPNAWLFVLIYASFNVGVATVSYFLPTLIKNLGFTAINAQGLTVAPYAVGWLMVVFQAWHSDRTHERGYHIMVSCAVSFIGYVILAGVMKKSIGAAYFALFLVVGANYSLFPLVMSWAANVFSPTSKRGVGTAFIVSVSNCVSIASPQIYFDPEDSFRKGHAISAGMLALAFLATLILRTRLSALNKRNRAVQAGAEAKQERGVDEEIWDTDPRPGSRRSRWVHVYSLVASPDLIPTGGTRRTATAGMTAAVHKICQTPISTPRLLVLHLRALGLSDPAGTQRERESMGTVIRGCELAHGGEIVHWATRIKAVTVTVAWSAACFQILREGGLEAGAPRSLLSSSSSSSTHPSLAPMHRWLCIPALSLSLLVSFAYASAADASFTVDDLISRLDGRGESVRALHPLFRLVMLTRIPARSAVDIGTHDFRILPSVAAACGSCPAQSIQAANDSQVAADLGSSSNETSFDWTVNVEAGRRFLRTGSLGSEGQRCRYHGDRASAGRDGRRGSVAAGHDRRWVRGLYFGEPGREFESAVDTAAQGAPATAGNASPTSVLGRPTEATTNAPPPGAAPSPAPGPPNSTAGRAPAGTLRATAAAAASGRPTPTESVSGSSPSSTSSPSPPSPQQPEKAAAAPSTHLGLILGLLIPGLLVLALLLGFILVRLRRQRQRRAADLERGAWVFQQPPTVMQEVWVQRDEPQQRGLYENDDEDVKRPGPYSYSM